MNFFALDVATAVGLVVSVVLPILSSLLAREHWPQELTGILTLVLATANGFFVEWASQGTAFNWEVAVSGSALSFFLAVAARYGLWKGTATDARALALGSNRPVD